MKQKYTIEQRALLRTIKDLKFSDKEKRELVRFFLFVFDLMKEKIK